MKSIIPTGFLIIFLIAAFVGFAMGANLDLVEIASTLSQHALEPSEGQNNLLLIGANLDEESPHQLQSVWLVIYFTDKPQVTLIPIFPDPSGSIENNRRLAQAFQIKNELQPPPEFWQALDSVASTWWDGYILVDEFAAIKLIDSMGGIQLGSEQLRAVQIVGDIPAWQLDAQANLRKQTLLMAGLCESFSKEIQTTDFKSILEIGSDHFKTDLELHQLMVDWMYIAQMEEFECRMPLSEQAQYLPFEKQP